METEYIKLNDVMNMCKSKVLDKYNWKNANKDNIYILFIDNDNPVGVVEISFRNNPTGPYAYLEMIEVISSYRRKGYGVQIVQHLQSEIPKWECVPIPDSEKLFLKCNFKKSRPPFWTWP